MHIVVFVRQVLDTRLPLEITPQGEVSQKSCSPIYVMDLADRCALEEAMRIRAEVENTIVTAITLGPVRCKSVLSDCLARGVDRAIHLVVDVPAPLDSLSAARILVRHIQELDFDLLLCGNRTLDDGPSEVGPALAELLAVAGVTGVVKLAVSAPERRLVAERKLERGYRQVVEADLPAVVSVDGSICQPRYVSTRARSYAARTLAERCSVVQLQSPTQSECPPLRSLLRHASPRPRPKKTAQPDSSMSVEDRMAMIMGGGAPTISGTKVATGPESAADEIIAFLKDIGVLT
ncbi:MAG: hypothetical protein HY675_01125 [Chloroflexi bacterium]|nr:hypothetical protein [Chloroflexota bacterium]